MPPLASGQQAQFAFRAGKAGRPSESGMRCASQALASLAATACRGMAFLALFRKACMHDRLLPDRRRDFMN